MKTLFNFIYGIIDWFDTKATRINNVLEYIVILLACITIIIIIIFMGYLTYTF
jgi:hypothetical protein